MGAPDIKCNVCGGDIEMAHAKNASRKVCPTCGGCGTVQG